MTRISLAFVFFVATLVVFPLLPLSTWLLYLAIRREVRIYRGVRTLLERQAQELAWREDVAHLRRMQW